MRLRDWDQKVLIRRPQVKRELLFHADNRAFHGLRLKEQGWDKAMGVVSVQSGSLELRNRLRIRLTTL